MRHDIPVRVTVKQPLQGVVMKVQRGKDGLLDPILKTPEELVFEFDLTVDLSQNAPKFLGKYSHGPKDARFLYVNSGTYARQHPTVGPSGKALADGRYQKTDRGNFGEKWSSSLRI
ncbi:MAG: hypothetical protein IPO41_08600 [Acidobacteria bacterium]|nr:hypothetical protein [Acidobacteriota bacterium]